MTPSPAQLYSQHDSEQPQYFRICNTCQRSLPITHFEKANHGTTLRGECRECRRTSKKTRVQKDIILNPITSKLCAKCKLEKPVEEFAKYSIGRNGLHSYCKECKLENDRAYAAKRSQDLKEKQRLEYLEMDPSLRPHPKPCSNADCIYAGELQPPENFHKSRIHKSGLLPDCIICEKERKRRSAERRRPSINEKSCQKYKDDPEYKLSQKKWRDEHKEELNRRTKQWRDENPEECRRLHIERRFRQYKVTPEWYEKTLAAQGGMCAICGSIDPKSNGDTFHVDHNHGCCDKGCHACDKCRRGLLCGPCNTKLGHLENEKWKRQAMAYLNKFSKGKKYDEDQGSLFD